jgi:hypothetical protein
MDNTATIVTDLDDVLTRRQKAKAEIDRLKMIVSACDGEILSALDSDYDEFTEWVREVRGEVKDYEARKFVWQHGNDTFIVYKRKGSKPRATISPEKLLKAGVPAHVIQSATTYGQPGKEGVAVRKITNGVDDSEEE